MGRNIVARLMVAVLVGIASGYAIGRSLAADAARGKNLTFKEYVADFEQHKQHLESGAISIPAAIFAGILMVTVFLALYELLVVAADRALRALDRRRNLGAGAQPGTPPPW